MQPFIRDGMKSIVWTVSCESQVLAIMKPEGWGQTCTLLGDHKIPNKKPLINGLSAYAFELAGLIKAYNVQTDALKDVNHINTLDWDSSIGPEWMECSFLSATEARGARYTPSLTNLFMRGRIYLLSSQPVQRWDQAWWPILRGPHIYLFKHTLSYHRYVDTTNQFYNMTSHRDDTITLTEPQCIAFTLLIL